MESRDGDSSRRRWPWRRSRRSPPACRPRIRTRRARTSTSGPSGTRCVSTGLSYTDDGRVVTMGVRDRSRGLDWASAGGGLGFRVVLRAPAPDAPADADPAAFDPVDAHGRVDVGPRARHDEDRRRTGRSDSSSSSPRARRRSRSRGRSSSTRSRRSSGRPSSVTNTGLQRVLLEDVDGLDAGLTAAGGALTSLTVNNFNWGHPTTPFETAQTTLKPGARRRGEDGPDREPVGMARAALVRAGTRASSRAGSGADPASSPRRRTRTARRG